MKSSFVILLKADKSLEERDENANRVIKELREKGFTGIKYRSGTTFIIVPMLRGAQADAIRIMKIPDITFYIAPDHLREVLRQ